MEELDNKEEATRKGEEEATPKGGATSREVAAEDPSADESEVASAELPKACKLIDLTVDGQYRQIALVGTAHVSKSSVEDVRRTIEVFEPDTVCVELCEGRYRNIVDKAAWKELDIFKVLKEGKAPLLLSSLVMTSFQRRIADALGVEPGAEMVEGIRLAKERDAELVLADRDIQITLRRTWGGLGFFQRLKMLTQMIGGLFIADEIDEETIENLKNEEELAGMLESLAEAFPQVKGTLIDERDLYLAQKIREAPGKRIVAIVGAGHSPGITEHIQQDQDLAPTMVLPKPSLLPKILKWAIPAAVFGLLAYGFMRGGIEESMGSVAVWFLVNGVLSAIGAAAALGHPLTILSAFVAAPITSLNPLVAAGWVAGLVQAWVKKPTVQDLEDLPSAITSIKGFWTNPVSRVLLVVVLANLGSTLGTIIGGSWVAARSL